MSRTDSFRTQHDKILQIVGGIVPLLSSNNLGTDAGAVRRLLAQLTGMVSVHLAMEDNSLYPAMLTHKDARLKTTAQRYQQEMGGIKGAFENYTKKWASATSIQANPDQFVKESKSLFETLGRRIARENNELYSLLDGAE